MKARLLLAALIAAAFPALALAQASGTNGPIGGGGGGAGTVSSGTAAQIGCYAASGTTISGCNLGSNFSISGSTLNFSEPIGNGGSPVTASTYTIQTADCGTQLLLENASGVAVTVPAASGFAKCQLDIAVVHGFGTSTLTPASGTIGGNSSISAAVDRQCGLNSDGTTWWPIGCTALVSGSGGGSSQFLEVSSNVVATVTTWVTVASFSAAANTAYYVVCHFSSSASAGTGAVQFTGPSSPTLVAYDGGVSSPIKTSFGNAMGISSTATQTANANVTLNLQNGVNAGTVSFQVENLTGGSDTATIYVGSYCQVD